MLLSLNLAPNLIGLFIVASEPGWHFVTYPILSTAFMGMPRLLISVWCLVVLLIDGLQMLGKAVSLMPKLQSGLTLFGLAVGLTVMLNGQLFAVPPAQVTSAYPGELVAVLNQAIAPYLFRMLMILFWLSLAARIVWLLRGLVRTQRIAKLSY